jgi:glucokinase
MIKMSGDTIGVDVGGTKILGVVLDSQGAVRDEARAQTPRLGEELLDAVAGVVDGLARPDIPGLIGVGAPGLVDVDGVLRFAPNLPGIVGLPMRSGLETRLAGAHVRVANDASCGGWAERVLCVPH